MQQKTGLAPTDSIDLSLIVETFEKQQASTLSERIYGALRHAILIGDLLPSAKLPEKDLTAVLPVSRTPLREALRRLEAENLVTSTPNRGVVVRGINLRDLLEVYETLEVLESYAVERAAQRMTPSIAERLKTHLDLADFYAARHMWEENTAEAVAFHDLIYETAENQRLSRMVRELREMTHSFRRYRLRTDEELARGLKQHREVLDALVDGDGRGAAAAMRDHVSRSTRLVQLAIEQEGRDDAPFQSGLWVSAGG